MNLTKQLQLLAQVADDVSGRVSPETQAQVRSVLSHSSERLEAGPQTVIALGGATGSGKSSLFNAISGTRLAEQGQRRPTTSKTLAVSFAASNPRLLDLLGIERRHEAVPPVAGFADVILLDLPDHDSTSSAHRAEVDKLVGLVDQFVWVLDPQKYADAAIHERYLRPLAGHREVITVVLNHADQLSGPALEQCLADIRRLLDADGLVGVPLLATSALTGLGIDELRGRLAEVAQSKKASVKRLTADVHDAALALDAELGNARIEAPDKATTARINTELATAAGVPVVVDAVRESMRHRGQLATGWPMVKWIGRLKPDPLKRLRLGGAKPKDAALEGEAPVERSSLPARSSASASHRAAAVRLVASSVGDPLPTPWRKGVLAQLRATEETLGDDLDQAVVTTNLKTARRPVWWQIVRALQWVLIAAVVVGFGWLTLNAILGYLGMPPFGTYPIGLSNGLQVPLPTALLIGGIVVGIVLAGASQLAINAASSAAARRARKRLEASVSRVADERLIAPALEQAKRYQEARKAVDKLL